MIALSFTVPITPLDGFASFYTGHIRHLGAEGWCWEVVDSSGGRETKNGHTTGVEAFFTLARQFSPVRYYSVQITDPGGDLVAAVLYRTERTWSWMVTNQEAEESCPGYNTAADALLGLLRQFEP